MPARFCEGSVVRLGYNDSTATHSLDVEGFRLKRSPYVMRVGYGPCAMAIKPRFSK